MNIKKILPLFFIFYVTFSYGQNISVNTTGAAAASTNLFEVLQPSTTTSTVGMYSLHSGGAGGIGTGYGLWAEKTGVMATNIAAYLSATGGTNNYALIVPSGGGKVGIGTTSPVENFHVIGNYQLSDNATPTKSYRWRTTGSDLDFEGGGKDIYMSVFANADFTGTQYKKIIMGNGANSKMFDLWEWKTPGDVTVHSINANGGVVFNEIGGDNDTRIEGDIDPNLFFVDASTDRVGIGTTVPGGQFELSLDQGRKPSTNLWTIVSDERLKNIEGIYTKGLKEILQLQPITYHYKNVGERKFKEEVLNTLNVGFSAQDVQKIFPEAVGVDEDGYLNFNMHSILVAYVNAIKEQQKIINNQQLAIQKLETSNNNLQSSNLQLQIFTLKQESRLLKLEEILGAKVEK